jgi:hypothetical protein
MYRLFEEFLNSVFEEKMRIYLLLFYILTNDACSSIYRYNILK